MLMAFLIDVECYFEQKIVCRYAGMSLNIIVFYNILIYNLKLLVLLRTSASFYERKEKRRYGEVHLKLKIKLTL